MMDLFNHIAGVANENKVHGAGGSPRENKGKYAKIEANSFVENKHAKVALGRIDILQVKKIKNQKITKLRGKALMKIEKQDLEASMQEKDTMWTIKIQTMMRENVQEMAKLAKDMMQVQSSIQERENHLQKSMQHLQRDFETFRYSSGDVL